METYQWNLLNYATFSLYNILKAKSFLQSYFKVTFLNMITSLKQTHKGPGTFNDYLIRCKQQSKADSKKKFYMLTENFYLPIIVCINVNPVLSNI